MRRHARALALAALALALPNGASAQRPSPVAGTWIAEFVRGVRIANGQEEAVEKGKARVTLEQHGDSVTGTWVTIDPLPAGGPKPRALRGTIANGTVRLVSDPFEATMNQNGAESKVKITTTYEFTVAGDAVTGTMRSTSADGAVTMDPRPFNAAREKKG